jgi:hypothetical protein
MKSDVVIPIVVFASYLVIGTTAGVLMGVYGHDPGGAVVLAIFAPFMVAGVLLCLVLTMIMLGELFG